MGLRFNVVEGDKLAIGLGTVTCETTDTGLTAAEFFGLLDAFMAAKPVIKIIKKYLTDI